MLFSLPVMKHSRHIISILVLVLLCGCYYPKVHLTRSERKLIAYDRQKQLIVFCSDSGVCDTVHFQHNYTRKGYVPNFDHWWELHISHTAKRGSARGFYYSVVGTSNFPANKYSDKNLNLLSIKLSLVKTDNDDDLILMMDGFTETYAMNEKSKKDTLVFTEHTSEVTCPSGRCLRKAYWTAESGLIRLEKYDDSIWKRKQ